MCELVSVYEEKRNEEWRIRNASVHTRNRVAEHSIGLLCLPQPTAILNVFSTGNF